MKACWIDLQEKGHHQVMDNPKQAFRTFKSPDYSGCLSTVTSI